MTVTYLSPYGVWRHSQGSCAKHLTTVSREMPWHPQRRHHWSSPVIRHANTAWSGFDALTRHLQPQTIKAREHAQIRAIKDSIGHVEVFQMDGVGISIIERPRPLPGHDTPNPAHNTYTLKCEEPVSGPGLLDDLRGLNAYS